MLDGVPANHGTVPVLRVVVQALCHGFAEVVDLSLIRMFSESELCEVLSGRPHVDLDDLQANVKYTFGYVSLPLPLKLRLSRRRQCKLTHSEPTNTRGAAIRLWQVHSHVADDTQLVGITRNVE